MDILIIIVFCLFYIFSLFKVYIDQVSFHPFLREANRCIARKDLETLSFTGLLCNYNLQFFKINLIYLFHPAPRYLRNVRMYECLSVPHGA